MRRLVSTEWSSEDLFIHQAHTFLFFEVRRTSLDILSILQAIFWTSWDQGRLSTYVHYVPCQRQPRWLPLVKYWYRHEWTAAAEHSTCCRDWSTRRLDHLRRKRYNAVCGGPEWVVVDGFIQGFAAIRKFSREIWSGLLILERHQKPGARFDASVALNNRTEMGRKFPNSTFAMELETDL